MRIGISAFSSARELGQQVVELEDEADVAVAKRHELRVGQIPQRAAGDPDAAGVDRVEPAQHVQQRALADARGADDGDHLALLDRHVEVAQHAHRRAGRLIALGEAADFDQGHGSALPSQLPTSNFQRPKAHRSRELDEVATTSRLPRLPPRSSTPAPWELGVGSWELRHWYLSACAGSSRAAWRDG